MFRASGPRVSINPSCGPTKGFRIEVNANGFKSDSTVLWDLVNSQSQIPMYGFFKTNSDGGFSDIAELQDLENGNYKIYFGDDTDEDTKLDVGAPTTIVDLTIPCQ